MLTTSGVPALSGSGRSLLLRWLIAIVGFPIGGYIGHLVGGPAATVPAALISGLIAGAIIGVGQGLALGILARRPSPSGRGNRDRAGHRPRGGHGGHRADRHETDAILLGAHLGSRHRRRPGCFLSVNESPTPGSGS